MDKAASLLERTAEKLEVSIEDFVRLDMDEQMSMIEEYLEFVPTAQQRWGIGLTLNALHDIPIEGRTLEYIPYLERFAWRDVYTGQFARPPP